MRIAMLTDSRPRSPKVLAYSLLSMLRDIGEDADVFEGGYGLLKRLHPGFIGRSKLNFLRYLWNWLADHRLLNDLRENSYDLIILVSTIPLAFRRNDFGIERLRNLLPGIPIVMYGIGYLGNSLYLDWLKEDEEFSIERYDWHLCVSPVTARWLAPDQPCSVIGMKLDEGELYPVQPKPFKALLDFPSRFGSSYEEERRVRLQALEALGIEYMELRGEYSVQEIRRIYRETALYFLSSSESFGLPIVELQACGAYVLAPDPDWPMGHRRKLDADPEDPYGYSKNFVFYEGLDDLKAKLSALRKTYDPFQVRQRLLDHYPTFYYGDLRELRHFLDLARQNELWGRRFSRQEERKLHAADVGR